MTGASELNGLEKEVILDTGFRTSVELQQKRKWSQIIVGDSFLSGKTEETAMEDYVALWEAQGGQELVKEKAEVFRGAFRAPLSSAPGCSHCNQGKKKM